MKISYHPNKERFDDAKKSNEPVLLLVSFDSSLILAAPADEVVEHTIMLKKMNYSELDIDKYFRVIVNNSGADWTFVCPGSYKGIADKTRRIEQFFNDGIDAISAALKKTGYEVEIEIPARYRRHFKMLGTGFILDKNLRNFHCRSK